MSWIRFVLLLVLVGAPAVAAQAGEDRDAMPPHHPMMMDDAQRAAMLEKMQARQHKLDELVAAMEMAEGDAKVDAIARVVSELVAQRKAMAGHMQSTGGCAMGAGCGCATGSACACATGSMPECPMHPMGDCPMKRQGEGPESP